MTQLRKRPLEILSLFANLIIFMFSHSSDDDDDDFAALSRARSSKFQSIYIFQSFRWILLMMINNPNYMKALKIINCPETSSLTSQNYPSKATILIKHFLV